jgi:hypothetical protein
MRVLRLLPASILAWCTAGALAAQTSEDLKASAESQADSLVAKYRADYAVPDAPALTLLGLDGSELVRPSTVRDLAVGITDFVGDNGQFRIPRAFSVEFSPGLLFFGRTLTLAKYQKAPVLYRLRVSAATQRIEGSGTASGVAFAVRTSPIDGADLRTNGFIQRTAAPIALAVGRIDSVAEARADAARLALRDSLRAAGRSPAEIREAARQLPSAIYQRSDQQAIDSLVGAFKVAADSARDDSWQRQALDLAVGMRLDARDSTGTDLKVAQVAAWLTYAGGVADWAQWVVGAKMASARDSVSGKYRVEASLATRWYAGTNRYKVFVDFQGTKQGDDDAEWLLSSGTEINVFPRVWATASLGGGWGPEQGDGKVRLKFGLRAAMPGR